MAISLTAGSETVTTTEHYVVADSATPSYQTTDAVIQLILDLSDMIAGDELLIKFYEKTPTNAVAFYTATLVGVQSEQWISPQFIVGIGWEISLDCIAGTSIAVTWTLAQIT